MKSLGDLCRDVLRHALDIGCRTRLARSFGDGIGHLLDVAEARIVQNQHLRHSPLPWVVEDREGHTA